MAERKQNVDIHRKIGLRKRLLSEAGIAPGSAVYLPFCGDGDIAAETYGDFVVYGADLDAARVATASARLPEATIVQADCDTWPFPDLTVTFAVADFDAYAYPYDAFRAWWANAKRADRCVVFFTDGERMAINAPPYKPHMPDGTKIDTGKDAKERRRLFNYYWARTVRPWFERAVDGWTITAESKYLRGGSMLYWGAVLEREGAGAAPETAAPTTKTAVRASVRELQFAVLVNNGKSWPEAARNTSPPYKEEAYRVARRCIRKGLIADPNVVAAAMKDGVQRGLTEMRDGSRLWLVGYLYENREKLGGALLEAVVNGNVAAMKEALNRLLGLEVQKIAPTTPDGSAPWQPLTDEEIAGGLNALAASVPPDAVDS